MRMTILIIGLLVAGIVLPVVADENTPATPDPKSRQIVLPYPMPEIFLGKENGAQQFIKAALEYIQKNPSSPFVARLSLDIYMAAIYTGNVQLAEQTRTFLLLNVPNHLYGSFLLSTFKTPQQLHDFIVPYVSSDLPSVDKDYCNKLYQLVAASIHMQGWDFLKDATFMVKCAALIDRAAPDDLKNAYMDQMDGFLEKGSTELKIVDICFKRKLSNIDRVAMLDTEFPDDLTARFVRMVLMVDLEQTDLASSRMLQIRSQQLVQQGLYAQAIPVIEQLIAADNQSQYRFWLGWCQASLGQTDAAKATLAQVPSDPWRGAAQRLERQLASLPENLGQHSQIIQAMVEDITTNLDGLEMMVQGKLPDEKPFDLYIGIGPEQSVYLQLKENGRVEVAYHSDKDMCEVYLEKYARRFKTQGAVPIPIFDIQHNDQTNKFNFSFAISIKPWAELAPALKQCMTSPYLTTNDGLSKLMVGMIQRGSFPAAASQTPQGISLKWMTPSLRDPQFTQRVYTVDTIGKLLAVTGSNLSITRIKYGPREQMVLSAPAMPRANYVEANEADDAFRVNAYNRILKTLMAAMK